MTSEARQRFEQNSKDIDRLLEIHGDITPEGVGRKYRVEVLHKSAIVLITAFWEAFCEDLAAEGVAHLVRHGQAKKLPKHLRTTVGKELKAELNDQAVWELADDGWRAHLERRLDRLRKARNWDLNTPKAQQISDMFRDSLGITDLTKSWSWPRMAPGSAAKKLNDFVRLRGDIAHRGEAATGVTKTQVTTYQGHVQRLVDKTETKVAEVLTNSTGVAPWE
ncbi:Uncharacterised protein [Mycobacterium tuberculosis]|nr:Uncharacterised protein [Mycobacterium tuberculosis]